MNKIIVVTHDAKIIFVLMYNVVKLISSAIVDLPILHFIIVLYFVLQNSHIKNDTNNIISKVTSIVI